MSPKKIGLKLVFFNDPRTHRFPVADTHSNLRTDWRRIFRHKVPENFFPVADRRRHSEEKNPSNDITFD